MKKLFQIEFDNNRTFGLDILRALAILFVVFEHGVYLLPIKYYKIQSFFIFDGVSIFFVLSGFLIGSIFIKTAENKNFGKVELFDFWKRRWFRTLPNYFLILLILMLLQFLFRDRFSIAEISKYFIFSQNFYTPQPYWFYPEAWSLSIEEWFYILVPISIFAGTKVFNLSVKNAVLFIAIIVIIGITLIRYFYFQSMVISNYTVWDNYFRKLVITRLDSPMYGVLAAYVQYYFQTIWSKYKTALFITGIAVFVFIKSSSFFIPITGVYYCVFGFSVTSVATALLLPFLNNLKSGKGLFYKALTSISLISYSMYLLNLSVVQRWILGSINWISLSNNYMLLNVIKYLLFWMLTIALSILLYKYYETPMTKLRDKK